MIIMIIYMNAGGQMWWRLNTNNGYNELCKMYKCVEAFEGKKK